MVITRRVLDKTLKDGGFTSKLFKVNPRHFSRFKGPFIVVYFNEHRTKTEMTTADCLQLQINTNHLLICNCEQSQPKNVSIQMYTRILRYTNKVLYWEFSMTVTYISVYLNVTF